MAILEFSQRTLSQLTCPEGKTKERYFDEGCTGLMLEVRPSGTKTYFLRYRNQRQKAVQMKLGRAVDLTVAQARALAHKNLGLIAQGIDPLATRQTERKTPTFAQFATEKYLPYAKSYKRSWDTDECLLRVHLIPRFGNLHLDEITQAEVMVYHQERLAQSAPGSANRLVVLMRYIYNLAIKWETPGVQRNPAQGISIVEETKRERYLSAEELGRLQAALETSENPLLKCIVCLLVLTGARKGELLTARWEDFDLERRTWRILITKSGKARTVPLSDAALAILSQIPRIEGCPYVLGNPKTKRPFKQIFCSWDTARKKAGLADVRIHDLRHSFASFLINAGRSIYEVGKLLGHTQISTTMRYAHLSTERLLEAVNVVPLGV